MNKYQKITLFSLRILLGWLMFYAGITKILDPMWSASGYLETAKTFQSFYFWLGSENISPIISFINEWALLLLGVSLLTGTLVRLSTQLGIILMLLYYFPVLEFPYLSNGRFFIVDDHIIYSVVLLLLCIFNTGKYWGLDGFIDRRLKTLFQAGRQKGGGLGEEFLPARPFKLWNLHSVFLRAARGGGGRRGPSSLGSFSCQFLNFSSK